MAGDKWPGRAMDRVAAGIARDLRSACSASPGQSGRSASRNLEGIAGAPRSGYGKTLTGGVRALGGGGVGGDRGDVSPASGPDGSTEHRDQSGKDGNASHGRGPVCRRRFAEPARIAQRARRGIVGWRFGCRGPGASRWVGSSVQARRARTMGVGFAFVRAGRLLSITAKSHCDGAGTSRSARTQGSGAKAAPWLLRRRQLSVFGQQGLYRAAWRTLLHYLGWE